MRSQGAGGLGAALLLPTLAGALAPPHMLRTSRLCMMGGGFAKQKDSFKYTGKMRPGKQSPTRAVPETIAKPDYALDGRPKAKGAYQLLNRLLNRMPIAASMAAS